MITLNRDSTDYIPPSVAIADAAKEAIDMALKAPTHEARDDQLIRAIQQLIHLRGT